jgi:uncharacterized phage infection (PIP) family protein YhgE
MTMNLKLEELRKRLLDPTTAAPSPGETIYRRSAEGGGSPEPAVAATSNGSAVDEPGSTPVRESQNTAQSASVASTVLQYVAGDEGDKGGAKSRYHVAQAVAKVFESTRMHQERLAELSKSFDSIEQMAQSAARAFEPIRAFHAQMEKLSKTFEPMHSFQEQLGAMAETFEPMKALHDQMVQMAEAFQVNLAQFARSLEPAKNFQAQIVKLAKTFEMVGELQAQFLELSEAFRVASRSNGNAGDGARN